MSLSDIVNVNIGIEGSDLTLPGFGVPLLLGPVHSNFPERVRFYSSESEILQDGFVETDAVYRQAQVIFSQRPRPERVAVGRRVASVAQVDTIRVVDAVVGDYTVSVNGQSATVTRVAQTETQLRDELRAAVNALAPRVGDTNVTAADVGVGTGDFSLTADVAGIQFPVSVTGPATGSIVFVQTVDCSAAGADGDYDVRIGNRSSIFTAVGNSATEIRDGLRVRLNEQTSETGVTAVDGVAADTIDLTNPASPFVVTATGPAVLAVTLRTLNGGIPEDLDAITMEQADWYALLLSDRDAQTILSAARTMESRGRLFLAQTNAAAVVEAPFDAATPTDVASRLKTLNLARTAVWFSADETNEVAAGIAGRILPEVPSSNTWKFKTLANVAADSFSTTQLTNMKAKSANGYRRVAGRDITFEGTVAEGEFLDVIRGVDKLTQDIQARIFTTLSDNPKVRFTNPGIRLIAADVTAALQQSTSDGLIAESRPDPNTGQDVTPAFSVTPPLSSSIPQSEKRARRIPASNPIKFEGTLAGAIHETEISGTVSV